MNRGILFGGLVVVVAVGAFFSPKIWRDLRSFRPVNVPPETNVARQNTNAVSANSNSQINANTNRPATLPPEVNLSAPFTSQAPHAIWDEDHDDFCEEASVLMAARAWQGRSIASADDAEAAMQQIKQWQLDRFGLFKSTTAAQTMEILTDFYNVPARLLSNPTLTDLKTELAAGHLIIVPAAGRELGNPNFRQPGPLYHMLLLKGYTTKGTFITHDPGTRHGKNYVYSFDVLRNAIHDWNDGDVERGQAVVIVVG